jgi:hypothetical protein
VQLDNGLLFLQTEFVPIDVGFEKINPACTAASPARLQSCNKIQNNMVKLHGQTIWLHKICNMPLCN